MKSAERIIQLVYDAIEEVNRTTAPEQALEKSPDTVLIGEFGKLDSLGFVNLVTGLEENIKSYFGKQISLIDLMVGDRNFQWTVTALATSIAELLDGVESGTRV